LTNGIPMVKVESCLNPATVTTVGRLVKSLHCLTIIIYYTSSVSDWSWSEIARVAYYR